MRSLRVVTLLHLLANGLILWLGYYWLGVGESRTSMLEWSAFVFILFAALGCCAYGAALAYFRDEANRRIFIAWRTALRNVLPLFVAAIFVVIVYWLLDRWSAYSSQPAFRIASWLTLTLRKPVRPLSVEHVFSVVLWVVQWAALPVLVLPAASGIAWYGWKGFRFLGARASVWIYWIEVPLLMMCLVRIPLWLVRWVPDVQGFGMQAASFTARATVAYLLFGVSWLGLAFVTSGGKPRRTESSTAD